MERFALKGGCMVTVINCGIEEFRERTKYMKIYCFGSGKYFKNFITHNPEIQIVGVIDNYCQKKTVIVENKEYQIYSMSEFCEIYNEEFTIVITVRAFEEILDQLDEIKLLDNMQCFISYLLDDYNDIENSNQKVILENQIKVLSERTYIAQYYHMERIEKHYQIWEYYERANIGGSKARTDIYKILMDYGYMVKKIHCTGIKPNDLQLQRTKQEWERLYESIEDGAAIFIQHPAPVETVLSKELFQRMKYEKHVCFIIMVHEVESLRKQYDSEYRKEEFETILSVGDVFIVHNDVMRQFYIDKGITASHVISLEIFDYLDNQSNSPKVFEVSVTIAANLDLIKSPYLLKLKELAPLKIYLYGPNYDKDISKGSKNIYYYGSLPTEIIPQKMDRGFGLVWDGDSIETCSGGTGEYLKYNNPHKLSLYLSAGLPVIIWSGAAQAKFVKENNVGFCVDSLYEIEDILKQMKKEQYESYVRNAELLSCKLKEGKYIRTALNKAEEILEHV